MRIPKLFDLRWIRSRLARTARVRRLVRGTRSISVRRAGGRYEWLESFKAFPPRQKAASFTVDQIVEKLMPKS